VNTSLKAFASRKTGTSKCGCRVQIVSRRQALERLGTRL
jgi:hypothetical protein